MTMGTIVSLDAYRQRRSHLPNWTNARLPELVRETAAPSCQICGRPIAVPGTPDPFEARVLLRVLRREGLCASCYAPF